MARKRTDLLSDLFSQLAEKKAREVDQLKTYTGKANFIAEMRLRHQDLVATDPARRIAVRCPRRSGKSFTALTIAVERALRKGGVDWVIVGLTRPNIKRLYWRPLLKMNEELSLGAHPQHTELIFNLPNGSRIFLVGAENRGEIEKLRGGAYAGVIIDECKSFQPVVFRELLQDVLEPALLDHKGQLILIGTPGDQLAGPFYEATAEPAPLAEDEKTPMNRLFAVRGKRTNDRTAAIWSLHTWTLEDNTAEPDLWVEALRLKADHNYADDHPTWRREFLGHWVAGFQRLVYRYQPDRHDYCPGPGPWGLPLDTEKSRWKLVQGIDLGFRDATAIAIWAYSDASSILWEVYSEARKKINIRDAVAWIRDLDREFPGIEMRVVDPGGGGAMLIDAMQDDGVPCEAAERARKLDHIELMNADFDQNRIRIRRDSTLSGELLTNRWLEKTLGTANKKEDPVTPNDTCDAALYAYRFARHRNYKDPTPATEYGSLTWWADYERTQLNKLRDKIKAEKAGVLDVSSLDKDWWQN